MKIDADILATVHDIVCETENSPDGPDDAIERLAEVIQVERNARREAERERDEARRVAKSLCAAVSSLAPNIWREEIAIAVAYPTRPNVCAQSVPETTDPPDTVDM